MNVLQVTKIIDETSRGRSWDEDYVLNKVLNRPLHYLVINTDKNWLTFTFLDGDPVTLEVEAECCSSAWIEHLEVPTASLEGLVITDWIAFPAVDITDSLLSAPPEGSAGADLLYQIAFRTRAGDIILEFRNTSNGYYGAHVREHVYYAARRDVNQTVDPAWEKHMANDRRIT